MFAAASLLYESRRAIPRHRLRVAAWRNHPWGVAHPWGPRPPWDPRNGLLGRSWWCRPAPSAIPSRQPT